MEEVKKMYRDPEEKKRISKRLSIIQGQVGGVKKMIDEDRASYDVLIQLQAIDKSIQSLSTLLFEIYVRDYAKTTVEDNDEKSIEEFMSLIKMFQ